MQKHNEGQNILKYNLLQAFRLITKGLQTQPEFVWLINNRGVKEKAVSEKLIELSELVFIREKFRQVLCVEQVWNL